MGYFIDSESLTRFISNFFKTYPYRNCTTDMISHYTRFPALLATIQSGYFIFSAFFHKLNIAELNIHCKQKTVQDCKSDYG